MEGLVSFDWLLCGEVHRPSRVHLTCVQTSY